MTFVFQMTLCARFLLLFAIFPSLAFAEKVNFLLPQTSSENAETVTIPVEWNESWFGEKPSTVYNHDLARVACYFSDAAYASVLENPHDNVLFDAYKKIGIKESDIEAKYAIDYTDAMWGNDQCAFSIASKKIKSSLGMQTLIFVVIRGTPLNANEWISNLNINNTNKMQEALHKGFAAAANIIHTALISYMLRRSINPTDAFLFVTGHSRGGAVSNVLSTIVLEDDFFKHENIYTYTFAAPNVTTSEHFDDEKYGFIWNIVNAEDIVPTVPMNRENWKFKKFGHVLAFANQTNTDKSLYRENYVAKISEIYEKISGRQYKPFTTGPFVPIMVTKLVERLSGDVEGYYSGAVNLHTRAANLMARLFPEKKDESDEEKPEENSGGFGSWLVSWLNNRTGGLVDYASLALSDMHSNDVYLAHMLALSEDEVFSDSGYSVVVVHGFEEFAVLDSEQNVMARVIDGKIFYSDMKFPIILCPSLGKNVTVGYPSNLDFEIAVTDEAIFSTPISLTVEFFDAAGVYLCSESKKIYPRKNKVYVASLGTSVIENNGIAPQRIARTEGKKIIAKADLKPEFQFNVIPELYMNTDFNLGFGLHVGTPAIFGSIMTAQGLNKFGKSGELHLGLGNQQTIFSQIKMENEIFAKFIWLEKTNDEDNFFIVPTFRTSLSLKVIGRLRIFSAGSFDFQINDYNDKVFETKKRTTNIHTFRLGNSLRAAPSIQFGIRF